MKPLTDKQKITLERGRVLYRLKGIKDLVSYTESNKFTEDEKDALFSIMTEIHSLETRWSFNNSKILEQHDKTKQNTM